MPKLKAREFKLGHYQNCGMGKVHRIPLYKSNAEADAEMSRIMLVFPTLVKNPSADGQG
jgi:hypothetical protein